MSELDGVNLDERGEYQRLLCRQKLGRLGRELMGAVSFESVPDSTVSISGRSSPHEPADRLRQPRILPSRRSFHISSKLWEFLEQ
jgi:hypothetical protein